MRPVIWFCSAVLIAVATLLHVFYIEYKTNSNGYIFSFPASQKQIDSLASQIAPRYVQPERSWIDESPTREELMAAESAYAKLNCSFNRNKTNGWAEQIAREHAWAYDCSRPFVAPPVKKTKVVVPAVSFESAYQRARKELAAKEISHGLRPSQTLGGDQPSKTMIQKAFWLGVVLPLLFIALSACLVLYLIATNLKVSDQKATRRFEESEPVTPPTATATATAPPSQPEKGEPINLRNLLKADFGIDFPIAGGTGNSKENPIVILREEPNDYTSCEYGVLDCIARGRGVEWKLVQQAVMHHNGRTLDQMKVKMTQHSSSSMHHTIENYYFDITDCVDF